MANSALKEAVVAFYAYAMEKYRSSGFKFKGNRRGRIRDKNEWLRKIFGEWYESQDAFRGGFNQIFANLKSNGKIQFVVSSKQGQDGVFEWLMFFDFEESLSTHYQTFAIDEMNRGGIEISLPVDFGSAIELRQVRTQIVVVSNFSSMQRVLHQVAFITTRGRFRIVGSGFQNIVLDVNSSTEIAIEFAASSVGVFKSILRFDFDGFSICRYVTAKCGSTGLDEILKPKVPFSRPKRKTRNVIVRDYVRGQAPPVPAGKLAHSIARTKVPEKSREDIISGKIDSALERDKEGAFSPSSSASSASQLKCYTQLMHNLMFVEEVEWDRDIRQYDLEDAVLTLESGLYRLTVEGLGEKRPSVLRGDSLIILWDNKNWEGFVWKVELRSVLLKFDKKLHNRGIRQLTADVVFSFNRSTLNLIHQGLHKMAAVSGYTFAVQMFRPNRPQSLSPPLVDPVVLTTGETGLNEQQTRAVQSILYGRCRPAPFILYGPPGTGKTRTMVEAVRQVFSRRPSHKVLLMAPSNSAADLLLLRLAPHLDPSCMFRLNAFTRERSSVDSTAMTYSLFDEDAWGFSTPSLKDLLKYRVVVTTVTMGAKLYNIGILPGHFQAVFLDEAGHCTEPDVMGVLGSLCDWKSPEGCQFVLAGDPKQLGAIVRSSLAVTHGLGVSLLERLTATRDVYSRQLETFPDSFGYDPEYVVKLVDCYRCHESILRLPNDMFYDGDLRAVGDTAVTDSCLGWRHLPNPAFPIVFVGVNGENQREGNSPSWFNSTEVEMVLQYVQWLLEPTNNLSERVRLEDIAVITPYQKQVAKIRKALESQRLGDVSVGSVEQFQGQERRVVIVSTVRTNVEFLPMDERFKLGFVSNPKRFNVSVTRAKALLIVVGSPAILSSDGYWGKLLWLCVDNKAFVGDRGDLPPRSEPQSSDSEEDDDDGWEEVKREDEDEGDLLRDFSGINING